MKTIGLLGGMSWESTLHYYRPTILQLVLDRPGEVSKEQMIAALAERIGRWTSGE